MNEARHRQHPWVEVLGELTRDQCVRRIVLGGLVREDVSRTDENPLFVTELLRMLDQEGQLTVDGVADPQDWQSGFLMAFEKP